MIHKSEQLNFFAHQSVEAGRSARGGNSASHHLPEVIHPNSLKADELENGWFDRTQKCTVLLFLGNCSAVQINHEAYIAV